jgi:hypothetical protein
MISQQYHMIYDILEWNEDGSWKGWKLEIPSPPPPPHLQPQVHILFKYLKGASPLHQNSQYSRGWGAVGYTIKEGYKELLANKRNQTQTTWWKNVWNSDVLPKINLFCWTLMHGKILTGEILMKRGFHDPFLCALCQRNYESIQHLFWECPFSKKIWATIYQGGFFSGPEEIEFWTTSGIWGWKQTIKQRLTPSSKGYTWKKKAHTNSECSG